MTNFARWLLCLVLIAAVAWLWHDGALGATVALILAAASLLVFALPKPSSKRRRSKLRYIEMGKQPVGLP